MNKKEFLFDVMSDSRLTSNKSYIYKTNRKNGSNQWVVSIDKENAEIIELFLGSRVNFGIAPSGYFCFTKGDKYSVSAPSSTGRRTVNISGAFAKVLSTYYSEFEKTFLDVSYIGDDTIVFSKKLELDDDS